MTKVTEQVRRLGVWPVAAAAVVAVATAAVYPAQGAAALHRHHVKHVRSARLEHHTLRVQGTEGNDAIALRLAAGNPGVVQVDLGDNGSADFSFPRAAIKTISIEARGGNDRVRIDDKNGAFTDAIPTRIDGGPGNDTIAGGAGRGDAARRSRQRHDRRQRRQRRLGSRAGRRHLRLGSGRRQRHDRGRPGHRRDGLQRCRRLRDGRPVGEREPAAVLPPARRTSRWTPTASRGSTSTRSAAPTRSRSTTSPAPTSRASTSTSPARSAAPRATARPTASSSSAPTGTTRSTAAGDASGVTVSGLRAQVAIQHQEPTDQLFVLGVGGDDSISATGLAAGAISEFLEGGDGNDTIAGGPGAETLLGGNGNDTIDGNGGSDRAALGAGGDTFVWDPGDGSDTIEGEDGRDTLVFNGAAASETVDLSANGDRLRFSRKPGNITMDTARSRAGRSSTRSAAPTT